MTNILANFARPGKLLQDINKLSVVEKSTVTANEKASAVLKQGIRCYHAGYLGAGQGHLVRALALAPERGDISAWLAVVLSDQLCLGFNLTQKNTIESCKPKGQQKPRIPLQVGARSSFEDLEGCVLSVEKKRYLEELLVTARSLKGGSKSHLFWSARAKVSLVHGDSKAALHAQRIACEQMPDDPLVRLVAAEVQTTLYGGKNAERAALLARERAPSSHLALWQFVRASTGLPVASGYKVSAELRKEVDAALSQAPSSRWACLAGARLVAASGDPRQALQILEDMPRTPNGSTWLPVAAERVALFCALGEDDAQAKSDILGKTQQLCAELSASSPHAFVVHQSRAQLAQRQNDLLACEKNLQKCFKAASKQQRLAVCLSLADVQQALATQSISKNRHDFWVAQALKTYESGTEGYQTSNAAFHLAFGKLLLERGEREKASVHAAHAQHADPLLPEADLLAALSCSLPEQAVGHYHQTLSKLPEDSPHAVYVRCMLLDYYIDNKQWDKVAQIYRDIGEGQSGVFLGAERLSLVRTEMTKLNMAIRRKKISKEIGEEIGALRRLMDDKSYLSALGRVDNLFKTHRISLSSLNTARLMGIRALALHGLSLTAEAKVEADEAAHQCQVAGDKSKLPPEVRVVYARIEKAKRDQVNRFFGSLWGTMVSWLFGSGSVFLLGRGVLHLFRSISARASGQSQQAGEV